MKTISQHWMDFLVKDVSAAARAPEVAEIRGIYYAGVTRGVAMMRKAQQLGGAEAGKAQAAIFAELRAYAESMAAAPAPAPDAAPEEEAEDEDDAEESPV